MRWTLTRKKGWLQVIVSLQVIANILLLLCGNLMGYYYQFMNAKSQDRTVEQTRSTVESRVKLECEKEHQEQLLLSVIPAYIAAEVLQLMRNFFFCFLHSSIFAKLNNTLDDRSLQAPLIWCIFRLKGISCWEWQTPSMLPNRGFKRCMCKDTITSGMYPVEKSIHYDGGCNDYISPLCVSTNKSVCWTCFHFLLGSCTTTTE